MVDLIYPSHLQLALQARITWILMSPMWGCCLSSRKESSWATGPPLTSHFISLQRIGQFNRRLTTFLAMRSAALSAGLSVTLKSLRHHKMTVSKVGLWTPSIPPLSPSIPPLSGVTLKCHQRYYVLSPPNLWLELQLPQIHSAYHPARSENYLRITTRRKCLPSKDRDSARQRTTCVPKLRLRTTKGKSGFSYQNLAAASFGRESKR